MAIVMKLVAIMVVLAQALPIKEQPSDRVMHSAGFLDASQPVEPEDKTFKNSFMEVIMYIPNQIYNHIAVEVEYHNHWEELETFPERKPAAFSIMVATVKTWAADYIVQRLQQHRLRQAGCHAEIDWARSATFLVFGFIYVGIIEWLLYVSLLTDICPWAMQFANEPWSLKLQDTPGMIDLAKQVAFDNFLAQPFLYYPIFYIVKEFLAETSVRNVLATSLSGLKRYGGNFWTDNVVACVIWIPCDLVIFTCPMYMRMLTAHAVSFAWTMLMSLYRGAAATKPEKCGKDDI